VGEEEQYRRREGNSEVQFVEQMRRMEGLFEVNRRRMCRDEDEMFS